jgi:hypothetical protein
MEADDHAREHVDRKRHPWSRERSACFLVDDDQIHERVINLNDLERPRSCVPARHWRRRLDRRLVSAFARRQPPFDFIDASLYRSAIRQRPSLLSETQMNLFDQVRQGRALRLQIDLADRLADQVVARLAENERSLLPPSLSGLQRLDGRCLTIGRDQAVERRPADS